MARENKRKRLERRFGAPERLIDKLDVLDRGIPISFTNNTKPVSKETVNKWMKNVDSLVSEAMSSKAIVVDNVLRYFCDVFGSREFDWMKDLPSVMPPFSSTFIEMSAGSQVIPNFPTKYLTPESWGLSIHVFDANGVPAEECLAGMFLRTLVVPGASFLVWACLFEESRSVNILDAGRLACMFAIDDVGRIIGEPSFAGIFGENSDRDYSESETARLKALAAPAFLAIALMNCKNVTLTSVDPPREFNRERRKAGLKPFVRYHTINIEPMKKVLKTEGQIETVGLKRALHIARGHFATYSEEKPLFGKVAGTFWVPSHTRGSLKQGYVVSDYNVQAPAPPAPHGGGEG